MNQHRDLQIDQIFDQSCLSFLSVQSRCSSLRRWRTCVYSIACAPSVGGSSSPRRSKIRTATANAPPPRTELTNHAPSSTAATNCPAMCTTKRGTHNYPDPTQLPLH